MAENKRYKLVLLSDDTDIISKFSPENRERVNTILSRMKNAGIQLTQGGNLILKNGKQLEHRDEIIQDFIKPHSEIPAHFKEIHEMLENKSKCDKSIVQKDEESTTEKTKCKTFTWLSYYHST